MTTDTPVAISLRSQSHVHTWIASQAAAGAPVPTWLELYDTLLDELTPDGHKRWTWRQALYIAWAATPRAKRWPATVKGLASFLGLADDATIRHWRKRDPAIKQRIQQLPQEILLDHVADVFDAMVTVASTPDPRANPDRQLFLKAAGLLPSTLQLAGQIGLDHSGQVRHDLDIDLSALSDDQLDQLAALVDAAQHPG